MHIQKHSAMKCAVMFLTLTLSFMPQVSQVQAEEILLTLLAKQAVRMEHFPGGAGTAHPITLPQSPGYCSYALGQPVFTALPGYRPDTNQAKACSPPTP